MPGLEVVRNDIVVREIDEYSDWAAQGLGELMPHLDPGFSGDPTSKDLLTEIAESSHHGQLVAVSNDEALCRTDEERQLGRIVGGTSLSVVLGAGFGRRGEMEDVIVHPDARGRGVGSLIMQGVDRWCSANNVSFLMFVSEAHRPAALQLYERWGARRITDGQNNVEGILFRKDYPAGERA